MQFELLVHSMLSKKATDENLSHLKDSIGIRAKEGNLKGCLLIHKSESLHYISGNKADVNSILDMMEKSNSLTLIKVLHSGTEEVYSLDTWFSVESDETEEWKEQINELLNRLRESDKKSVGLQLFASVSEIILSERLYGQGKSI